MKAKALELRDEGTFIAILAVDMNHDGPYPEDGSWIQQGYMKTLSKNAAQRYLLRRCGYPCDGRPNVMITRLSGDGRPASNDPYYWGDRTFAVAHKWIIENWKSLRDGDVVDVQFIVGETSAPKRSEREEGFLR